MKTMSANIVHLHAMQGILERSNAELQARVSKLEEERKRQETHKAGNAQVPPQVSKLEERSAGGKMVPAKKPRPAPYQDDTERCWRETVHSIQEPNNVHFKGLSEAEIASKLGMNIETLQDFTRAYRPTLKALLLHVGSRIRQIQGSGAAGGSSAAGGGSRPVPQPVPQPQNPYQHLTDWQEHTNQIIQLLLKLLERYPSWRRPGGGFEDFAVKKLLPKGNFQRLDEMQRGYVAGQHWELWNELSFRVLYYDTLWYIRDLETENILEGVVGQDLMGKVRPWMESAKFDQNSKVLTSTLRGKVHDYLLQKYGDSKPISQASESKAIADLVGSEQSGMSKECCKYGSDAWWHQHAKMVQRLVISVINSDPLWRKCNGKTIQISDFGLKQLKISRTDFGTWHGLGHPVNQGFKQTTEQIELRIKYFDTQLRVLYLQKREEKNTLEKVLRKAPSLFKEIDRYIKMKEGEDILENHDKRSFTTQLRAVIYDYDPRILHFLCPSLQAPPHMKYQSASETGYWASPR